jgi:hypothetical protein
MKSNVAKANEAEQRMTGGDAGFRVMLTMAL